MNRFDDYEASEYTVPPIVNHVGYVLREPREPYSGEMRDLFSRNRETQYDYCYGLIFVAGMLCIFFTLWSIVMIVLKLKGREVGCASGMPFPKEAPLEFDQHDHGLAQAGSTDSSHSYAEDDLMTINEEGATSDGNDGDMGQDDYHDDGVDDESRFHYGSDSFSQRSDTSSAIEYEKQQEFMRSQAVPQHVKRREKRTRMVFLSFGVIACSLVPVVLLFSFGPLREALGSMDDVLLSARNILGQVTTSVDSIDSAVQATDSIIEETPVDMASICPDVAEDELEAVLGIDLSELSEVLEKDYQSLIDDVNGNITDVQKAVRQIDDGIFHIEETVNDVSDSLWVIPGILLGVTVLVTVSMFSVILAWKERSGPSIQRVMSYVLLPMLVLMLLLIWGLMLSAALATMLSTDMCTTSRSSGSPDQTIYQIMMDHELDPNDTVFKFVNAYTNGCSGEDPTADINEIESEVQIKIDTIWRLISTVDSIGRPTIKSKCGGDGRAFDEFLSGARSVAKQLTSVRRALDSAGASLQCQSINPVYIKASHDLLCTDSASASAYGFILFFALSLCVMILIGLRASWLRSIVEEKVYHNEDEVAENMFLDEHEEYLEYISRYKHEWQAYQGYNECTASSGGHSEDNDVVSYDSFIDHGSEPLYFEDEMDVGSRTDGEGYHASDENSYEQVDAVPQDGARSGPQPELDEISFPSLASNNSDDPFEDEKDLVSPPKNPEFEDDRTAAIIPQTGSGDSGRSSRGRDPQRRPVNTAATPDAAMLKESCPSDEKTQISRDPPGADQILHATSSGESRKSRNLDARFLDAAASLAVEEAMLQQSSSNDSGNLKPSSSSSSSDGTKKSRRSGRSGRSVKERYARARSPSVIADDDDGSKVNEEAAVMPEIELELDEDKKVAIHQSRPPQPPSSSRQAAGNKELTDIVEDCLQRSASMIEKTRKMNGSNSNNNVKRQEENEAVMAKRTNAAAIPYEKRIRSNPAF